ncbi:MAG: hypothetical protein ACHREM_18475 [Polyangiales bacterium]
METTAVDDEDHCLVRRLLITTSDGIQADLIAEANVGATSLTLDRAGEAQYLVSENRIVMRDIRSVADIAMYLHEVGHAEQRLDDRFRWLFDVYSPWPLSLSSAERIRRLEAIVEHIPLSLSRDVAHAIHEYTTANWTVNAERTNVERWRRDLIQSSARGDADAIDTAESRIRSCEARLVAAQYEMVRAHARGRLDGVLRESAITLERDATARALRRLRALRKRGIDLLNSRMSRAQLRANGYGLGGGPRTVAAESELLTVPEFLKECLRTYGGDRPAIDIRIGRSVADRVQARPKVPSELTQ